MEKELKYIAGIVPNPLAMKSGDKIKHRPPLIIKFPTFCHNKDHKVQVDKIGDLQAFLLGRNSAPDLNIDLFRYCPYCGKRWKLK